MTLPVTTRRDGPYSCNGVLQDFDFNFKVFAESDIQVILTDSDAAETTLTITTGYTVALNADQESNPGGTITTVATYATGNKITIIGALDYGQPTQLTNRGGFFPKVIERAMDRLGILIQQLKEQVDRSVKVDASSTTDPDTLIDDLVAAAADAEAAATAAAASYDAFDDRYLGSKTSDPALDNDGAALITGALYWNSVAEEIRVYNGTSWEAITETSNYSPESFSGDGSDVTFTLTNPPVGAANLFVYLSGVRQVPTTDYTLSGSTLTFTSAPPLGTNNIFTLAASTQDIGVPSDDTVSTAKLQDGAVTASKLGAGLAVPTGAILDFAGTSAPTGYLGCDGSNISRATYAALFSAIGTTWGAGDGSTTFTLPDFRRRVAVGSGGTGTATLGNAVGNTGGAETHTLVTAEMPSHTHPNGGSATLANPSAGAASSNAVQDDGTTTGSTGGDGAHNNMQPSAVVLKIIKT
jgi:microcystin-dependent protein